MKPEGSLPHSQQPATFPYPEPYQSSPCPPSHFLKIHFNVILPSFRPKVVIMLLQTPQERVRLIPNIQSEFGFPELKQNSFSY
jgi:hypothetical protein